MLAVGCAESEAIKDDPAPAVQARKTCKPQKLVKAESTVDFIYDTAGKLTRVNINYPNDPANNWYQEITYNGSGNIALIRYVEANNAEFQRELYTYNADNLPDTIFLKINSRNAGYTRFEYDAAKKLVKREVGDVLVQHYKEFSYPAAGQVKEMLYTRSSGNLVLNSTTINQYDTKANPYAQLGFYQEAMLVSPHNLVASSTTDHLQGTTRSFSFSHTYNTEEYPVETTASGQLAATWTYSCP